MPNLQAQYDQVVTCLEEYRRFVRNISLRVIRLMFTNPHEYNRLNVKTWKTTFKFDPLSEKTQDTTRLALSTCATDDERTQPFFAVATSDYPTDALSEYLQTSFPAFNFEKLKKIHESKQAQVARLNVKQILGVVFTASALVLKSVPKTIVEDTFNSSYTAFERTVFWLTVGLAVYLLLVLLPSSIKYHRAKQRLQRVGDILDYVVAKDE